MNRRSFLSLIAGALAAEPARLLSPTPAARRHPNDWQQFGAWRFQGLVYLPAPNIGGRRYVDPQA